MRAARIFDAALKFWRMPLVLLAVAAVAGCAAPARTGATLDACASALRKAGASRVLCLSVARTPEPDLA